MGMFNIDLLYIMAVGFIAGTFGGLTYTLIYGLTGNQSYGWIIGILITILIGQIATLVKMIKNKKAPD